MKAFRLLATSLLVALSMGISSCGDDELEVIPPLNNVEQKCLEYGITDYKDIELLSLYEHSDAAIVNLGQTNFAGLRNDRLWLASFNAKDKSPLINWTAESPFDRNRRIYKGYGEYEDVTIQQILMIQAIPFNQDFVASLGYAFSGDNHYYVLLFKNGIQAKEVNVEIPGISTWYGNSITNNDCCYSFTGDTLYISKDRFSYQNIGTLYTSDLISYEDAIFTCKDTKGFYVGRRNFKTGQDLWKVKISELSEEPNDAKIEVSVEDKSKQVWIYNIYVTYYDGTTKSASFEVNIENGAINGQDNNASPLIGKWLYTTEAGNKEIITFNGDNTGSWESVDIYDNSSSTDTFSYTVNGNEVIIDFGDGSPETYRYEITDNEMKLTYEDGHTEVYAKQ